MAQRKKTDKAPKDRTRVRRKKAFGESVKLTAPEVNAPAPPEEVLQLSRAIQADGGVVLSAYREPYGGTWLLLSALPLGQVKPTPYQRDLSETHADRLADVISRIGRFLDPIIAVRAEAQCYWTPNGHHRLMAMKTLRAQSIPALVIPERAAAYQILALNTEKAHNLRERALEVIRMYRELAGIDERNEEDYALEFEEAALLTLGICYESRPRFSGGAYHPMLKRVDQFLKGPLRQALGQRQQFAGQLLEIDDAVIEKVNALKERGLASAYLKNFVVARINPVRFKPKGSAMPPLLEVLAQARAAAEKLNPDKIRPEDLAKAGGVAPSAD